MSAVPSARQIACATFTHLAVPGHPVLAALLQAMAPEQVMDCIRRGGLPPTAATGLQATQAGKVTQTLAHWRAQLEAIPSAAQIAVHQDAGVRLVCPGDSDWPPQLDDLGPARPYALWVRGTTSLAGLCQKSVAVAGSRAATAYGLHICAQLAGGLAAAGWTIISGGAYGIDAYAHRAALTVAGPTIAVMACGPDVSYPREHASLLTGIAVGGAVVSEYPPGTRPHRYRFLARNRLIAALANSTLIIEASARSGSLATARRARQLGRPLMAVPGLATSATSAGCHALIRDQDAALVTSTSDVLARLAPARPATSG